MGAYYLAVDFGASSGRLILAHMESGKLVLEEVHRFAISYHKKLRKKHVTGSVLEEIEGVGTETRKKLLRHFKTLTAIKEADLASLLAVPGLSEKVSKNIYNFFHKTS